jgi:hypothetical protein
MTGSSEEDSGNSQTESHLISSDLEEAFSWKAQKGVHNQIVNGSEMVHHHRQKTCPSLSWSAL